MALFKTTFGVHLLLLIECFRLTELTSTSILQNELQVENSPNEVSESQVNNKENNLKADKKIKIVYITHRSFQKNKIPSVLGETYSFSSTTLTEEAASTTSIVPIEQLPKLTKKNKPTGNFSFQCLKGKKRRASFIGENSNEKLKYTPKKISSSKPLILRNRDIKNTTTCSKSAFYGSYCPNPKTLCHYKKHRTKDDSDGLECVSTEMNFVNNANVSFKQKMGPGLTNSNVHQVNTQQKLHNADSVSIEVAHYYHDPDEIKNVPVTNNITYPCDSRWTRIRNMPPHPGNAPVIIIYHSDKFTNVKKFVLYSTPIAQFFLKIRVINEPLHILCDTPHSLNKKTFNQFCDYLFSVNGYIIYRQLVDESKKLIGGIILEFDNPTNRTITRDSIIENLSPTVESRTKICYILPIFVALNFITPPNLQHFKLSTTRRPFGIICIVEVLVSFVSDVTPIIDDTFLTWRKTSYTSIFNFILSSKFPIYSFKILKNDGLWFSKKHLLNEGKYIKCMTIQEYFDILKASDLDFNIRTDPFRYKKVEDFPNKEDGTFISLNMANDIIYTTCMFFLEVFNQIQSILHDNYETETARAEVDIDMLIKEIQKNLKPNWCIIYHEDIELSPQICELISFYSFFYHEVKYVLEYCFQASHFPLVNLEE